ncbi:MAG: small subunit ribosomal protein [Pseudonocardiales bacterium]|nr:small subunit ribosomal protein [Pseudonocardiales bacterium]
MTTDPVTDPAAATSEDPRDTVTTPQTTQPEAGPAAPVAPAPLVPAMPVPSGQATQAVGRRKEAVVRVRLVPGTGVFKLNGTTLEKYFPNKVHQQLIRDPLVTVNRPESYDVFANLSGGGTSGQAGALRLAIARALIEINVDDRPALKKAGFLTRDSRATERKKYGLKKARKAPQYSKR